MLSEVFSSVRADGMPSLVENVRSDNGGELFVEKIASSVCNELLVKQEFTPAYRPQYNGVAERGLGLIEDDGGSYSGESSFWTCAVT